MGASLVLVDDGRSHRTIQGKAALAALPPVALALNGVGGASSTTLASMLAKDGVIVTYGGMSKQPTSISAGMLIFRNITARGFWLSRWSADQQTAAAAAAAADNTLRTPHLPREMMDELYSLVKRGKLKMPAREVSLDEALHAISSPTAVGTRKLLIRF
uniref:Alcohol dehydrogenase-like C-terminal domain-containing protein n=1 Tax=Mantoniella antarctica TaxID=81844 RepID=A0A7S0SU43_9CHLO|mmetsp:Transcript_35080/g.87771  ORF Transcript_35080/g.87771 Transcript_35080/m.87771 type:complete len:159 (+) Transcript_35080:139-615(+)